MSFEVPASKASVKQNQFQFTVPGERKNYSLPYQQYLTNGLKDPLMDVLKKVAPLISEGRQDEIAQEDAIALSEATRDILEALAPGVYAKLDQEQTNALIKAWADESRTSLGKSSAS